MLKLLVTQIVMIGIVRSIVRLLEWIVIATIRYDFKKKQCTTVGAITNISSS